ncbi:hypothetical protein [Capillimicrobium parvum]|uniref:Alpha/beta hydrolase n=1 Tax=Capillimicrobium parvum TaxID=2884022 RepID=A0A9E6XWJ4_9ACTN|nr:hypothetical protein [Capillimicrobium parvum]UGS35801.1 hypothetical protein DSM104329_02197 [Capillimicrobium parvum]
MDVLDFRTEEEPGGAEHLLVSWPGLRLGGVSPRPTLDRLARFRAHKLNIAADGHTYIGPRRSLWGARASVDVVRAEMARLGVRRENVIAYGPSVRAVCALWMGFQAEVGRIIGGGAPIRMGRRLRTLDRVAGASPEAIAFRDHFLSLADADPPASPSDVFFDEMIHDAARAVTLPTKVHLLVSPDDEMYDDNVELAALFDRLDPIECHLDVIAYGRHGGVKDAFKRYLTDTLREAGVPRRRAPRAERAPEPVRSET